MWCLRRYVSAWFRQGSGHLGGMLSAGVISIRSWAEEQRELSWSCASCHQEIRYRSMLLMPSTNSIQQYCCCEQSMKIMMLRIAFP